MTHDELLVGIIGSGIIGSKQITQFSQIPGVRVVAVSDIVEDKARKAAAPVGAKPYSDYRGMLRDLQLDIVSVATPDQLHREPVLDAIDAGVKNIVCEKPLATDLEEGYAMADAVRSSGVRFCVDFENRWNPTFRSIRMAIAEGLIGTPVHAAAALSDRIDVPLEMWGSPEQSWARRTTCADFLLSHWTDLIRWFVGQEPDTVYAVSHRRRLGFTPDCFQALMRYAGDFSSYFETSWILSRSQPSLVSANVNIMGTEGTIYCNFFPQASFTALGTEIFTNDLNGLRSVNERLREEGITSEVAIREEDRDWRGEPMKPSQRLSLRILKEGHDLRRTGNAFKHIVECVRLSKEPDPNIDAGLMQVRMVQAIKGSAESGRIVDVRDL